MLQSCYMVKPKNSSLCTLLHSGPVAASEWCSRAAPWKWYWSTPNGKWPRQELPWARPPSPERSAISALDEPVKAHDHCQPQLPLSPQVWAMNLEGPLNCISAQSRWLWALCPESEITFHLDLEDRNSEHFVLPGLSWNQFLPIHTLIVLPQHQPVWLGLEIYNW